MQDLNDKITGGTLPAVEWNEVPSEIQNVIEALGQTLSSGDLNQLGKGIAGYVANSNFYTDSGIADAYVLSVIGLKQRAPAYTDGFVISFLAGNDNTGPSTVNVASLGVKNIKLPDGTDPVAQDISGRVSLIFDSGNDRFELLNSKITGILNFPNADVNPRKFGAVGDGATNDTTAITNAEAYAQANGLSLLFTDGDYITDSVTLDVTARFEEGAKLNVNAAQTVTINKKVEAGLYQIFDGSGSILFNDEESHVALPEWFGAFTGQSGTDTSLALQKLSDSIVTGRECFVPFSAGTYFLSIKVTWSRACRVFGVGERITHFRCTTDFPTGDVFVTADEGVTFQNIQFSSATTPRTSGAYIGLDHNFGRANNIWFTDGFNGIRVDGNACKVRDVTGFLWATGVGAYIVNIGAGTNSTVVEDITYIDSTTFKPDYIVRVESAAEFVIDKVNAKGFSVAAVGIVPTTGTANQGQIDNIIGRENGPSALLIKTVGSASVESMQIGKVQADGLSGVGTEFRKESTGIIKFIQVDQLESRACPTGFKVSASVGSIDHWHISGGFCRNGSGNGYDIANADQWTINGTESISNTGTGALIAAGCNDFIYTSNRNRFNGTNFTDNSGAVTKVVANNLN